MEILEIVTFIYNVTQQVVPNLPLTSKQKFHSGLARPGKNRTLVLKSTGGLELPAVSPSSNMSDFASRSSPPN